MKVKAKMFPAAVKSLTKAQLTAAKMTAEQMWHEKVTDAMVPLDEGTLQNVSTYIDSSKATNGLVTIVHDIPYAQRLYYHPEYNFDKTINANAQGEWWNDWLEGDKKLRPVKLFKIFYKKVTGGLVK